MTPRLREILTVTIVALLAVFAAWGWIRKPAASSDMPVANYAAQPSAVQPAMYDTNAQRLANDEPATGQRYANDAGYARPAMSNGTYSYAGNGNPAPPCVTPAMYYPSDVPAYASRGYVRTVHARPVTQTNYVETGRAPVSYYTDRSKKKSAMIVAGGAGAGAAIGALAGGGKGAGIGAVTGGVGGFIYDRLTHRHRVQ